MEAGMLHVSSASFLAPGLGNNLALLGGSWVVVSEVMSRTTAIVMTIHLGYLQRHFKLHCVRGVHYSTEYLLNNVRDKR